MLYNHAFVKKDIPRSSQRAKNDLVFYLLNSRLSVIICTRINSIYAECIDIKADWDVLKMH